MNDIDASEVERWLDTLETSLRQQLGDQLPRCAMVGIRTGGVAIARELHQRLQLRLPLGELNISFYRDDFSRIGMHPVVGASDLPFQVEDQIIILVDDVLFSGRTIRAAMNELFDFGRPQQIVLAVLVDRQGRQLPIQADALGHSVTLPLDTNIKLDTDTMTCSITSCPSHPPTAS